jgi:hypothetical protein
MALALCCRLIRSHARFMHGLLVIWRNAGRLTFRHPSELHAGSPFAYQQFGTYY